jgi:ABC-type multidrug transport system fused ATPase/permease subunit
VLVSRGASVKFEHVDFRYSDSQRIFADLNLHFRPGERVGLVGHSDGGKSTMFALLQRFYDPAVWQTPRQYSPPRWTTWWATCGTKGLS